MKCKLKTCKKGATKNPYEKGLFCSARCALNHVRTKAHQKKAAKKAAKIIIAKYRGTGTKTYVKENGRHQHRVVMERILGRKLRKGEIVHHVDKNKKNNHPNNLMVMTQAEHARCHGIDNRKKFIKMMVKNNTKYGPKCLKKWCRLPNKIGRAYCPHHQYRFEKFKEI